MPSTAISGGIAFVGLVLMSISAGFMSKTTDKKSSKYKGLIAGVVIGVFMLVAGLAMMAFGGSAPVAPNNGAGGPSMPSENIGSKTVSETASPLNLIEEQTHQTELSAALNSKKAANLANHAKNALEKTAQLKSIIGLFKR
jgi:flagellar basal body-associated protein FliL